MGVRRLSETEKIVHWLASVSNDPLRFVLEGFPWGVPGSELESFDGPEPWQVRVLCAVRDGLLNINKAIRIARASGHGVGKSALVSWLIIWAFSTFEDCRGVVTANTEAQLRTKTWAELGKWHRLFIAKELFKHTATGYFAADSAHGLTWRIDMVPWSERSTEAFAGLHNKGRRIIVVFDEASAIPDIIWETTEGALTDSDTQIIWATFGNPTRNTGRFRECWTKHRALWDVEQVDARNVSITNKDRFAEWIVAYGDDSDFVRVRIKGQFPRASGSQFISSEVVDEATKREPRSYLHDPLVLGVDVARFGDDESVIYPRKGRDGRTISIVRLRGVDTMTLAGRVCEMHLRMRADAVFVDGGGVGGGVVDRLRQLHVPTWDIQFGSKSDMPYDGLVDGVTFANKRAEIWGSMREWLKDGSIPDISDFRDQLCGVEYGFNIRNEIQLERKEDMKKRLGPFASPDIGDALALTFAYPVVAHSMAGREGIMPAQVVSEYDPMDVRRIYANS